MKNIYYNIECKYSLFKLALDDENISHFNVSEKGFTDIKIANIFHPPVQA